MEAYRKALVAVILVTSCGYAPGPRGRTGRPGSPCTVTKAASVVTITCPDGTQQTVVDGERGLQGTVGVGSPGAKGDRGDVGASTVGPAGQPGTQITPVVPCPGNTSGYPEVLLCIDDSLYAVYDDAPNDVHYAKIPPGDFITTDGRQCRFSVATECTLQ